jgi:hypothetical protein
MPEESPEPPEIDTTVEGPHITDVAAAKRHQAALAERERALTIEHAHRAPDAAIQAIRLDRSSRWTALLKGREESGGIREWARLMTARFESPAVAIRGHRLSWVMALYVVRYGESEHYWPAQLDEADLARATRWYTGATPRDVTYLPGEE